MDRRIDGDRAFKLSHALIRVGPYAFSVEQQGLRLPFSTPTNVCGFVWNPTCETEPLRGGQKNVTFLPQAAGPQRYQNNDIAREPTILLGYGPGRFDIGLNFLTGMLIAKDAIQIRTCRSILAVSVCL